MLPTPCISTCNSSSPLIVTTLFDTGADPTLFVDRQVAAWIESQHKQRVHGKRMLSSTPTAPVALAGSVVFDLIFFSEVTRSNETLYPLHSNVIDRPVIREHHNFLITSMRRRALNLT